MRRQAHAYLTALDENLKISAQAIAAAFHGYGMPGANQQSVDLR
jgi:hypothetical protein